MSKTSADWDSRIGRRIRLRDLEILSAVVRCGSMARAASRLGMSQPSVSEAIANLEAVFRVSLLDRSPRGVQPTVYGLALLKRSDIVLDELRQGIRDIEFLADPTVGEVRVGCPESLAAGFVSTVVDRLTSRFPRLTVHVVAAQTGEQEFRELRERSVDLLLGRLFKPLSTDEIAVECLCMDTLAVATGGRSAWARRRNVVLAGLINEPWILFPQDSVSGAYIAQAFQSCGLDLPRPSVTSFSMQVRLHLLSTGRFLTVLHRSVLRFNGARWGLKELPVDLRIRPVPVAIFTLKNRTLGPATALFIEHAREVAKSLPAIAESTRAGSRPG